MLIVYANNHVAKRLYVCSYPSYTFRYMKMINDEDDVLLDDIADFGTYTSSHLQFSDDPVLLGGQEYIAPRRDVDSYQQSAGSSNLSFFSDPQPLPIHRTPVRADDTELLNLDVPVVDVTAHKSVSCLNAGTKSCDALVNGYAWFLTRLPYIPIILTVIVLVVFAGVSYKYHPPPDFTKDPTAGFETRGTYIRKAMSTGNRVYHAILANDGLSYRPNVAKVMAQFGLNGSDFLGLGRKKRNVEMHHEYGFPVTENEKKEREVTRVNRQRREQNDCDCRGDHCWYGFPTFVFEPVDEDDDLFTAKAMRSICKFNQELILPKPGEGTAFCPSQSIPSTIAEIVSKDSCLDIDDTDILIVRKLIEKCGAYAMDGSLASNTSMNSLPAECTVYNVKYLADILIYMADSDFYDNNTHTLRKLKFSAVYMFGHYRYELDFYHKYLEGRHIKDDVVKLTALVLRSDDTKWHLLGEYLIEDLVYFGLALALVFFIMLLYLRSVVLMFVTILSVIVSFVTAYFIYFFIFQMKFFPFLNLLSLLVLIAVGADDVFVFYDCWEQAKRANPDAKLQHVMKETLNHAALSVFVTSLTTASAFFTNSVSDITSIQAFGIFAGISILCNFLFMVTLTPAAIICTEYFFNLYMRNPRFAALSEKIEIHITSRLHSVSVYVFERVMPVVIAKAWFLWILILLVLGVLANIAVFVSPRLELPVSKDFQVFPSDNLLENWQLNMATKFAGLKSYQESSADNIKFYFLWGILPDDPGNWLDPNDKGTNAPLQMDQNFDFSKKEVQTFFYEFCQELLKQDFMPEHTKLTCQMNGIMDIIKTYCSNPLYRAIIGKCCMTPSVPFDPETLEDCAAGYQLALYGSLPIPIDRKLYGNIMGDFLFDPLNNTIKAYGYIIESRWGASLDYKEMADYHSKILGFLNGQMAKGPPEVQHGFVAYTDWFWFYDLQHALATSTYYSIGLSMAVAFVVMLLTSLNILISLYAMATICLAIACTVAAIVFLGWHLNIIESIIISLAVGLSIDFTIHYGVAYRQSAAGKSCLRTRESFRTVGAAVAMATVTTFVAGAAMMPSRVLPYTKLGIFLMLVMTFSWLYANFFFQSVCYIIGPRGTCCQIRCCCAKDNQEIKDTDSNDSQLLDVD